MTPERSRDLVARLEASSAAAPARYRGTVLALTLTGLALIALVLCCLGGGLLVLVGLAAWLALHGSAALILLLKLGKLLVVLAIALWMLLKTTTRALFVRLPAPRGRELTRAEAPALFAALDRMRQQMKGPAFHQVLLVDDVNAAVVQRPAFGLVGWPRNYLLLGLPLLEGMSEAEALAVVAHEYGHLAGSHGHFAAFVYRLRLAWGTLHAVLEHQSSRVGRWIAAPLLHFVPYYNAYTFVLARADEYAADAASAALVGRDAACAALKRSRILGAQHERFIGRVFDGIAQEATPPSDITTRWAASLGEPLADADARLWLDSALDRVGLVADTHPTLRQRLSALDAGQSLDAAPAPLAGGSAAEAWLGHGLPALREALARDWVERVGEAWSERNQELAQQRQRLQELHAQTERSEAETYERWRLWLRLAPDTGLVEDVAAFNAGHPDAAPTLFFEGAARLAVGDASGIALLERAIALDVELTQPACSHAHPFLVERGDSAAEAWAQRWQHRATLEAAREAELARLTADAVLAAHGLDAGQIDALRQRLQAEKLAHVSRIHLARRVVRADPTVKAWVVGVEITWWGRQRSKTPELVQQLAAIEWPVPVVVAPLVAQFKPLTKKFRALPDARLLG